MTVQRLLGLVAGLPLLCLFALPAGAQNVQVSPGAGDYPTLKAAFDAINAGTHTGAITISVSGDTTETAPAVLNASGNGAALYTSIGISPTGGAARTISGAIVAGSPLIDLNGADNVTIDGLNTGGNSLTIANTTVSATSATSTIRFIGGATNNLITNSNIQGSGTMTVATNGATIFFSTDAVTANGNDNNTISNNNIGPAGANLPTKGILCNGSASTTAIGNSGNIVNNNNIFDYFGAAVTSAGIASNGGCNTWTISNNRLYQTATRTWTTGALHAGMNIGNTTATSGAQGFTITGNTVGFASNTQTGVYTLTGAGGGAKFVGILFNGIVSGATTNVNNNTVAGVSLTGVTSSGTSTSSPFLGMLLQEGNFVSNGNTIGSQLATGSMVFSTTTTSATDVYGFYNFSSNAWTANNNLIGGLSVTNLGASGTFLVFGMRANTGTAAAWSATGNSIGGSVANSIQLNATGAASQVIGMLTTNAPALLTSNVVRNLTSNIGTGTTTAASVIGISVTNTTPNHTLSQNTISNLSNTNAAAASVVTGIQFTGSTANTVERNFIHSLSVASNSAAAEVNGIRVAGGTTVYRNNMIAIGAGIGNAIGAVASNGGTTGVNGINEFLGTNSFFHNSVYIGGSPSAGTGASFAFNGSQTVNTRSFRDNIFWNARSNAGATGSHYAIKINGTAPNPAGLTINNNLYFANGAGAVFGFFNSLDVANIGAWRTAVGQDSGSFESNPQFLDPTNATPDLHLHPSNPTVAEGNGVDVGVSNDFDGETRSGLTPVDIGADAGNFVGIDLAGPNITYTAFGNTTQTSDRTLVVTLTDVSGVATGGLAPRIYYRKNADAYVSQACTLATGSVTNGTWNCPISYASVGGVVTTDLISYFVVAQDVSGNLTSNPAGAIATDVNTVGTPPASPNSYRIALAFSGTVPVGSGQTYLSLTNAGGLFEALNNGVATGNIEVDITSDLLAETGTHPLNRITEEGVGNYTLAIRPSGAARAISGSFNGALIRFAGANRVTVDGSVGGLGTDRSLTITNTSVTTPTVVLFGSIGTTPITDGTLRNTIITNGVNTSSAVAISDGTTVGNAGRFANIVIRNNEVRRAFIGVFANGGTTPQGGTNLTYEQNTINSAGADAIRIIGLYMQGVNGATVSQNTVGNIDKANDETDVGIWLASGTINATVSRNTISGIGYTGTGAFAPVGINVTPAAASSNLLITGNRVSDISTNGGAQVRGIALGGTSSDLTIEKNDVQGIINTNTGTFGAYGIDVSGANNVLVSNNFVSNVSFNMSGGGAFSTQFGVFGIRIGAGTGHRIYNNSVNLSGALPGTANSALLSAAFCVVGTTSTGLDVRDNIFANNITGGTTSIAHVPVFLPSGGTAAMNLTWNNNAYFFGTDAARQGVGQAGTTAGTNFFTTLPALAAYSSILSGAGTNDNASQASTAAVPFISATDLHLQPGSPLSTAGVPLAGVTTDIDNETRSATTPSIGADELAIGILAITPSPVDFTNVVVGATSAAQAATLSNSGAAPLTISALSAASAPFAQVGGTCSALPITINPGSNCTITYTFSPAALGSASQTISVTSNGTGATSFDLTGIGVQGALSISPTSLGFGPVTVGQSSANQTVTLSNTGNASLNITALDAAAAPFVLDASSTCGAPTFAIAAGSSCTLVYRFSPAAGGPFGQTINVTANAPGSGSIGLSGTGVVPGSLTINPTTVNFGSIAVGATTAEQTVTLSNTGGLSITVDSLTAAAAPFAQTGTGTCGAFPVTITAGSNCTLTYTFSPTVRGNASQTLTALVGASPGGTITLQGTGLQGELTISPTSINFGSVSVGQTSAGQTVTLTNIGNETLSVASIAGAAAPFAQSGGTCAVAPFNLTAGSNCTLTYTFTPAATGPASQNLAVAVTGPALGGGTIALSGSGTQGNLTITPTSLAFGNQLVGTTSNFQVVTLANTGSTGINVTLTGPATPFLRVGGGTCSASPIAIAAGANCTLRYVFQPTAAGAAAGSVTVTADAPGSGTIDLTGFGTQGVLTFAPASLNLGSIQVGQTSSAGTITLGNTGDGVATVTALTGATSPFNRTIAGTCSLSLPIVINPGQNCTLTYTFTPLAVGSFLQTLTLTSTSPGAGSFELTGQGVFVDNLFQDGFEDVTRLTGVEGKRLVPLAGVLDLLTAEPLLVDLANDDLGPALRVYARKIGGQVEVAFAKRDRDGIWTHVPWQSVANDTVIEYSMQELPRGDEPRWLLQDAIIR